MKIIRINAYPKNKKHFIKLKIFCKQILEILQALKIKPVAWGGLTYFAYTRDENATVHDIDLAIPYKGLAKVMKVLDEKRMKYTYNKKWRALVVSKGKLNIDLDPLEDYYKGKRKFNTFDFEGLVLKSASLDDLIKMYEKAARVSKDKPEQHRKRLEELEKVKKRE